MYAVRMSLGTTSHAREMAEGAVEMLASRLEASAASRPLLPRLVGTQSPRTPSAPSAGHGDCSGKMGLTRLTLRFAVELDHKVFRAIFACSAEVAAR